MAEIALVFAGEVELHRGDPDDTEMAVEALEASCIITPSEEERSRGQTATPQRLSSLSHTPASIQLYFETGGHSTDVSFVAWTQKQKKNLQRLFLKHKTRR